MQVLPHTTRAAGLKTCFTASSGKVAVRHQKKSGALQVTESYQKGALEVVVYFGSLPNIVLLRKRALFLRNPDIFKTVQWPHWNRAVVVAGDHVKN